MFLQYNLLKTKLCIEAVLCSAACWNWLGCVRRPAEADRLERPPEEGARRKVVRRSSRVDHECQKPGAEDEEQQGPGAAQTKVPEDFQLKRFLGTKRREQD